MNKCEDFFVCNFLLVVIVILLNDWFFVMIATTTTTKGALKIDKCRIEMIR